MSTERAPAIAGAAVPPRGERQSIPVRVLWFKHPRDVPGKAVATSLTAESQPNRHRWSIEFKPWMRCFTVTYTPAGDGKSIIRNLNESGIDWEPLDG